MGADKNFSETKLTKSQNHNRRFPNELVRSHSHNGPTKPRYKSHLKTKRKHNSRGNALSQICLARTDCP
jgi:hypothetical protein